MVKNRSGRYLLSRLSRLRSVYKYNSHKNLKSVRLSIHNDRVTTELKVKRLPFTTTRIPLPSAL